MDHGDIGSVKMEWTKWTKQSKNVTLSWTIVKNMTKADRFTHMYSPMQAAWPAAPPL